MGRSTTQEGYSLVRDGLVLYVDAANANSYISGSNKWKDLSINATTGILSGSSLPTYDSSNQGVLQFNSAQSQRTVINTPSQVVTGGAVSVALWAKWTTTGTTISTIQALVDNDHSAPTNGQGFIIQDRPDLSKALQFGVLRNNNGVRTTGNTPGVVNGVVGDGTWKYIVGTNDLTDDRIYINGVYNNIGTDTGGINGVQPHITIGATEGLLYSAGFGRFLNGSVALVKIYNRALSADEILQNYNATKGRFNL